MREHFLLSLCHSLLPTWRHFTVTPGPNGGQRLRLPIASTFKSREELRLVPSRFARKDLRCWEGLRTWQRSSRQQGRNQAALGTSRDIANLGRGQRTRGVAPPWRSRIRPNVGPKRKIRRRDGKASRTATMNSTKTRSRRIVDKACATAVRTCNCFLLPC